MIFSLTIHMLAIFNFELNEISMKKILLKLHKPSPFLLKMEFEQALIIIKCGISLTYYYMKCSLYIVAPCQSSDNTFEVQKEKKCTVFFSSISKFSPESLGILYQSITLRKKTNVRIRAWVSAALLSGVQNGALFFESARRAQLNFSKKSARWAPFVKFGERERKMRSFLRSFSFLFASESF